MNSSSRVMLLLIAACAILSVSACKNVGTHREAPTKVVPIEDIEDVAGKWSGLMERRPRMHRKDKDFVQVTINPDGTYEFATARAIGLFAGTYGLQLKDGQLKEELEEGYTTFTLYDRNGEQVIVVEALDTTNNYRYKAELRRAD